PRPLPMKITHLPSRYAPESMFLEASVNNSIPPAKAPEVAFTMKRLQTNPSRLTRHANLKLRYEQLRFLSVTFLDLRTFALNSRSAVN
ncbi:Hypothetical predicted protein, partial [Pelobates cultripes]